MYHRLINFITSPWIVSLLMTIISAIIFSVRLIYCPAIYVSFLLFIFLIQKLYFIRYNFKEDTRQNLIRLELNSIKGRMSPHFIFNVMSTISNLVLRGDKTQAYECIVKFSGLLRETLENSRATAIPLRQELALAEKYIALQWIRFSGNFDFNIKVDDEVNLSKRIPKSIIITFVEIAINQRLFQMHGGGLLKIKIFTRDQKTVIWISDNGPLEKVASNASTKSGADLSLLKELLMLINRQSISKAEYQIERVFNKYDKPTGTLVTIKIPNSNFRPDITL